MGLCFSSPTSNSNSYRSKSTTHHPPLRRNSIYDHPSRPQHYPHNPPSQSRLQTPTPTPTHAHQTPTPLFPEYKSYKPNFEGGPPCPYPPCEGPGFCPYHPSRSKGGRNTVPAHRPHYGGGGYVGRSGSRSGGGKSVGFADERLRRVRSFKVGD